MGVQVGATQIAGAQRGAVDLSRIVADTVDVWPDGPLLLARDAFERVVASGWGTADVGGPWAVDDVNATSVDGSAAVTRTTASVTHGGLIQGFSADDTETHVITSFADTAGARLVRIEARRTSMSSFHRLSVRQYGASHATSPGRVDISFDESAYTTGVLTGVAADALIHIKSRVTGGSPTLRQAKVWLDGTPEPSGWSAQTTTATGPQSGGGYGSLYFYSTGSEPGTAVHRATNFEVWGV